MTGLLARKHGFDAVLRRIWRDSIDLPRAFERQTCMACGYPTCRGSYSMCWICEWEDEPMYWRGEMDPDDYCGMNKSTLTDARKNFARYDGRGGMYGPDEPDFKRVEEREEQNRMLRNAYERLLDAETDEDIKAAVRYIREQEDWPDKQERR